MAVQVLNGDCREVLRGMPDASVQCCVTSPPYFGLRDYGTATWEGGSAECVHSVGGQVEDTKAPGAIVSGVRPGVDASRCRKCGATRIDSQIGLEQTPDAFVAELVAVFREVRRVLRDDGTLWLNLGDSYSDVGRSHERRAKDASGVVRPKEDKTCERCGEGFIGGLGRRFCSSFCGGSDNSKRTARPGALKAKDLIGIPWRVAFALQADGWYLRQDIIWSKPNPMPESVTDRCTKAHEYIFMLTKSARYHCDMAAIAEPAIYAGDVKKTNGAEGMDDFGDGMRTRAGFARGVTVGDTRNKRSVWTVPSKPYTDAHFATFPPALIEPCILAGCPEGGTVLDPFGGAGTTGLVADRLGRNATLIELNPDYAEMARRRIMGDAPLFAEVS